MTDLKSQMVSKASFVMVMFRISGLFIKTDFVELAAGDWSCVLVRLISLWRDMMGHMYAAFMGHHYS